MDNTSRAKETEKKRSLVSLLEPNELPAVEVFNESGTCPLLLVCDHASKVVPAKLKNLGLNIAQLDCHIAYDIGAAEVTRHLAKNFNAKAILAGYSRLVIDVNREPKDPQSILKRSDKTIIPGNKELNEKARSSRIMSLFDPYHKAISDNLNHLSKHEKQPALFSIHSFSPEFGDTPRPWDIGVLWNRDPRIAKPLMKKLTRNGFNVGDNLPYSGLELAYTLNLHSQAAGLANCVIEINQDQIKNQAGIKRWVKILTKVMQEISKMDVLYQNKRF
jgi:predicted N-formylglutamate amidohydrolase